MGALSNMVYRLPPGLNRTLLTVVLGVVLAVGSTIAAFHYRDSSWFSLLILFSFYSAARFGATFGLVTATVGAAHAAVVSSFLYESVVSAELGFVSLVWLAATFLVGRNRDLYKRSDELSRKLGEREELYRGLLHAVPDAIIKTDLQGIVTFCTERHAELLGASAPEDIVGTSAFLVIVPIEHARARANIERVILGEVVRTHHWCRRLDGSQFEAELSAVLLRDAKGNPDGLLAVLRDVTEERKRERQVAELLEEKTRLLSEVQHRTKNHMNTVRSFISLELNSQNDERARTALRETRDRVDVMQSLYDQLYSLGETENASIKPFLEGVISQLERGYAGVARIKVETEIADIVVNAHSLLMIGIVVNELVTNAFKYAAPEGEEVGVVNVTVSQQESGQLRIEIADNGAGFPPKLLVRKEFGFGLDVVSAYVEQQNGTFSLRNDSGAVVTAVFDLS